jgi:hypothetical protein
MEKFEHLWDYLKEDASGKVEGKNYMFKQIQGTLWLREAFIQAQYFGPQVYNAIISIMALIIGVASLWSVMLTLNGRESDTEKHTWSHLFAKNEVTFWIYNGTLIVLITLYQYLNQLFLVSGM